MLNQIRRIWADIGKDDKDFAKEELKLRQALTDLKNSAEGLSRASTSLLDLIHSKEISELPSKLEGG